MDPITIAGLAAKFLPDIVHLFTNNEKASQTASVVSDLAQKVTGATTPEGIETALQSKPELVVELRKAVMADSHISEQLRLQDVADARDMQKKALAQDDVFSKRFTYYYAIVWTTFAFLYISGITFFTLPPDGQRYANTILGFLLGTAMGAILQFFYGSSHGSKAKDETLNNMAKK